MPTTLAETVDLMTSSDYKERFKAEYYQLEIRAKSLKDMLDDWDNLDFTPSNTKELLERQYYYMEIYKALLIERAKHEGVVLEDEPSTEIVADDEKAVVD